MTIEWGTIVISSIVSLISAGGIGWIVTAREDKRSKQLDNTAKEDEIKEHRKDEIINDWKEIAEERKQRADKMALDIEQIQERSRKKDDIISELRTKLDSRNTYCAVAELLRCDNLTCDRRQPPISPTIVTTNASVEKLVSSVTENTFKDYVD